MMPKGYWRFCGVVFCLCYAPLSFSNSLSHFLQQGNLFVGVGAGASWSDLPNHTTVPNGSGQPAPYDVDRYSIDQPSANAMWALDIGYRWIQPTRFLPRYSLAFRYQHFNNIDVNGQIDQYSLPDFNNYNYSADINANTFMLLGKFNLFECHSFSPFVSVGIGETLNETSNYKEQALSGITARVSPDYETNTVSNFTYSVGAGIDYIINQSFSMSLEYEYIDLGQAKMGHGAADSGWSGQSLTLGTLTSNVLMLGVSYQIPS